MIFDFADYFVKSAHAAGTRFPLSQAVVSVLWRKRETMLREMLVPASSSVVNEAPTKSESI